MKDPTQRKADKVATAIEAQIISGVRKPGARLDERALATEFNVSRTPVREAIRKLAAPGLVTDKGRRGAVVRHLTVSGLLDAFLVVSELEGIAARLAARRMTPDEKTGQKPQICAVSGLPTTAILLHSTLPIWRFTIRSSLDVTTHFCKIS